MGDAPVDERGGTTAASPARRQPAIAAAFDQNNRAADGTPTAAMRRPPVRPRRLLTAGLVIGALLVGYYVVSFWQVYSAGTSDQARQVDAIVVMGAAQYDGRPSPQLAARLEHVVTLWPEGLAPLIVVTGGNQPGDRFTEADASAVYLIERGVPDSVILREDRGATSYESLERVAALLDERSAGKHSVLVVTDPYHTLRSKLIAEEVGLTAYGSSTPTSVVTGARSLERHVWEAGGVAIGRLTGFGWLSDLTD
jgi:uncharacterized SAM-binding protein YcdF (DUF218 family)